MDSLVSFLLVISIAIQIQKLNALQPVDLDIDVEAWELAFLMVMDSQWSFWYLVYRLDYFSSLNHQYDLQINSFLPCMKELNEL